MVNHTIPLPELQVTLLLALQAHWDQKDRLGEAYIFHPIRVMQHFSSLDLQTLALLHDVVEDTDYTLHQLRGRGYETILESLDALTHRKGKNARDGMDESYEDYIQRLSQDEFARAVKIEDLRDNIQRLRALSRLDMETTRHLFERYQPVLETLLKLSGREWEWENHFQPMLKKVHGIIFGIPVSIREATGENR